MTRALYPIPVRLQLKIKPSLEFPHPSQEMRSLTLTSPKIPLRFCPIALPTRFACALYGAVGRFASPARSALKFKS